MQYYGNINLVGAFLKVASFSIDTSCKNPKVRLTVRFLGLTKIILKLPDKIVTFKGQ